MRNHSYHKQLPVVQRKGLSSDLIVTLLDHIIGLNNNRLTDEKKRICCSFTLRWMITYRQVENQRALETGVHWFVLSAFYTWLMGAEGIIFSMFDEKKNKVKTEERR